MLTVSKETVRMDTFHSIQGLIAPFRLQALSSHTLFVFSNVLFQYDRFMSNERFIRALLSDDFNKENISSNYRAESIKYEWPE